MPVYLTPPPRGPVGRAIAAIVGALLLVGAFMVGMVAFLVLLGLGLVGAIALWFRAWQLRRQLAREGRQPASTSTSTPPGVIEGEFSVVSREEGGRDDAR